MQASGWAVPEITGNMIFSGHISPCKEEAVFPCWPRAAGGGLWWLCGGTMVPAAQAVREQQAPVPGSPKPIMRPEASVMIPGPWPECAIPTAGRGQSAGQNAF